MKRHLFAISTIGIFLFAAIMVSPWGAWGQDKKEAPNPSVKKADDGGKKPDTDSKKKKVVHRVESTEKDETEKTFKEQLDEWFKKAVDESEAVLFYSVGSHQEKFIELDHQEDFYRKKGIDGPFIRVSISKYSLKDEKAVEQLTLNEAKALMARGKLTPSSEKDEKTGEQKMIRQGKLNGEEVEYVSLIVDTSSIYVLSDNGMFYKKKAIRDALDMKVSLTRDDVDELAATDRLKIDADKKEANEPEPYIQSKKAGGIPFVVLWLALGAVFFTIYMQGFNIWGFKHAIQIVRGKYDNPKEPGEVTHFQALCSALSATVGLGNIAGVTLAMTAGGPGAFFWMLVCGLLGMSSKFVECTLGQKYRHVNPDGTILGGPMRYLKAGLAEIGLKKLGIVLSGMFAIMCILASFGGGNMYQANESGGALVQMLQIDDAKQIKAIEKEIKDAAKIQDLKLVDQKKIEKKELKDSMVASDENIRLFYGLALAAIVGVVIIGGIKRIGATAEKIVPLMCMIYILACLFIIFKHIEDIPKLVESIFTQAFNGAAISGGILGVIVIGVQRAAFSNEAGVGSAAIAHSAAKTDEPVREGSVALLGPFIDTIVVCSMTALVILITDAWNQPELVVEHKMTGAKLTSHAFGKEIFWFPYVLSVAVMMFAFSTIISWSYYGERCCEQLFGRRSIMPYKILTVIACVVGAISKSDTVLRFSDVALLSMAFPNILGVVLLSPKIKRDLKDYWKRYKAGEFKTFK